MIEPHSLNGRFEATATDGFLFAFGEDLEQQLAAAGVELDVAEFVEAEQIEPAVAANDA